MMKKKKKAFTLAELIIAVAIMAVIGVITVPFLMGGSETADLSGATQKIVALGREAETRSVSRVQNAEWGIHLSNVTGTAPFYAIFSGTSYATGTILGSYPLPPTVRFVSSTLPLGSSLDVIFSQISGASSVSTTVELYAVNKPSLVTSITFTSIGDIAWANIPQGGTATTTAWSIQNLPFVAPFPTAAVSNGYIYVLSGSSTVYASIGANGLIGSWVKTQPLPLSLRDVAQAAVSNGFIYLSGIVTSSGVTSTVLYAPINPDGSLGAWGYARPLPYDVRDAAAAAWNNRIYVIGGCSSNPAYSCPTYSVVYAVVNSNGSLGAWTPATILTYPYVYNHAAVAWNGYLYEVGGRTDVGTSGLTAAVNYAPINTDGSLGAWTPAPSLPYPLAYAASAAWNGRIYEFGGATSTSHFTSLPTANVLSASVNANGSLNPWTILPTPMPYGAEDQAAVAWNGILYAVGGIGSSGGLSTIASVPAQ